MKTIEIQLYKFEELSNEAQKRAIAKNFDFNTNYEWYEFIYEDAKEIGALIGIDIDNIYFAGFYSQGDGACFEGQYQYAKNSVKAVKAYAPGDTELHSIVERLQAVQKRNFYGLLAYVKHSGYYYHEMCTRINVEHNIGNYVSDKDESELTDILRDYMRWIYSRLDKENDYLTSDQAISESLISNEYDFTIEGDMY